MSRASHWLTAVGSSFLLAAAVGASPPVHPPSAEPPVAAPAENELQRLLERLSTLSESITREAQSPNIWRRQLEQAEVLMHLAVRSTGEERDRWMRMGVDAYYSAACSSPEKETTAVDWLGQLPGRILQSYPNNPVAAYAALQSIHARYNRTLVKGGNEAANAPQWLCDNLLRFAREYPRSSEASVAIMDAGHTYELMGKKNEARLCYRSLMDQLPGSPVARKAAGALCRMGLGGESVDLRLPLLYGPAGGMFDLKELRGTVVLVYFWSSSTSSALQDMQILRDLSDRYRHRGLEVVLVNVDEKADQARQFLTGLLTAGTHVHQKGGMDGDAIVRYGIQKLPETFLVGKDGALLRHGMTPSLLAGDVAAQLPAQGK